MEEEVFELRSENNVLRDKVKILQELLNSKDRTIPKGNPMETAKQQQKEQKKKKKLQRQIEGGEQGEGEGQEEEEDEEEEEEEEEEEGVSALPINYIPVQINNLNHNKETPINNANFQTSNNTTNTNATNQTQAPNVDATFQQYNKSSLYFLLVLFMILIFVSLSHYPTFVKREKKVGEKGVKKDEKIQFAQDCFVF
jgi:hypothetical protein